MPAERPPFYEIEPVWLFYALAAVALALFVHGVGGRLRAWRRGPARPGRLPSWRRAPALLRDGLLGARIFRGDLPSGLAHLLILWGFLGLLAGTALLALDDYVVSFLAGPVYAVYSALLEVSGLALAAGLLLALGRRWLLGPRRLERRARELAAPALLLGLVVTGFLLEGARMAALEAPEGFSFAGLALAGPFGRGEAALPAYRTLWWVHALAGLGLVAWLPRGKLLHSLAAPLALSIPERAAEPAGAAPEGEAGRSPLAFHQLVQLDGCTRCGRCHEVCPSRSGGEPLDPRALLADLRAAAPTAEGALGAAAGRLWYCTSCRACREVCPVAISPMELVGELRGGLVEAGEVPGQLAEALDRLHKYQNPWVSKKGQKAGWAKGLELADLSKKGASAEWLYFVGCTTSIDTRAQGLARALAATLAKAGLGFGTLGSKEPCCGDIARRAGERGLFEEGRDATVGLLRERGLRRIVTSSPHCLETFRGAYPARLGVEGGEPLEALHYAELLDRLVREGALRLERPEAVRATFHDPCFLGRHLGIYDAPRRLLAAVPGLRLVEMREHGPASLCCGGGGGRMWHELSEQRGLARRRALAAAETGAELLVTACPLCLVMLEDARKTAGLEGRLRVADLAEVLARAAGIELEA